MGNYSEGHICQCLTRIATLRQTSIITISGNRQKTGSKFMEGVLGLAQGLLLLGLHSGDVVAIAAYNSDLYLEWLLAIAFVGGIVAPLNYRWSFEEAILAMDLVKPILLLTDKSCSNWPIEVQSYRIASLRWHVSLDSPSSDFTNTCNLLTTETIKECPSRGSLTYSWAPEGIVLICFTSGTTGKPKGVAVSHSSLIIQSLAKIAAIGYSEDDVYLHTAPLCHIGSLSSAIAMLMIGACHVLIPKFETKSALETMQQYNVTSLITVPAMMADLISSLREFGTWNHRDTVKKILNGGGGLSTDLINDATKFFPRAKLFSAYGMTETCSSLTFMTLYDPTLTTHSQPLRTVDKPESISVLAHQQGVCVGKPAPHVELKICVDGSSRFGRILTRGPHLMLGYWDKGFPKASYSSQKDWLDTGDIGYVDEYFNLWLIGRINGRIKSGGENIYPEEVEIILSQHPGVMSVVVVGIPDARLTEMVVACIRVKNNWHWLNRNFVQSNRKDLQLSSEILRIYCKEKNLAGFKIPKLFILWKKPFPLASAGKIKRDEVRVEAMSHLQSFHGTSSL